LHITSYDNAHLINNALDMFVQRTYAADIRRKIL